MELDDDYREKILKNLSIQEIAEEVEELDSDDATDIILELPEEKQKKVISKISDAEHKADIKELLKYDEDSAGGLMAKELIKVNENWSVTSCVKEMRTQASEVTRVHSVYVVDNDDILLGRLSLKDLLVANPKTKIKSIYKKNVDHVYDTDSAELVASTMQKYDLGAIPVVNKKKKLLGRITIDDVIDSIKEEVDQPFRQISGLSRDTFQETFLALRSRGLWLGANLITALLASSVINLFQGTIEKVIFLAVLMPIIASMGGVAATQTLAITVRGLALGQIVSGNLRWILSRELIVSFWNGLFWSIILGLIASFWFKDFDIFLIIIFSMTINLIAAALSGISIPLVLRKLKFDPAIGGGVIVTTVTDIVGFFTFLGIASIVYA